MAVSIPPPSRSRLRGLYCLTDERWGGHCLIARQALAGGAQIIQLRDKSTPPVLLLPIARELRRLTREAGALFLVNDQLDLALLCEADGVHLGPDDWPVTAVRTLVGRDLLIGTSCGTPEEAARAETLGADYIGAGAVFATSTKLDAGDAIGLAVLRSIVAATTLPVAAIGGIDAGNVASVVQAGARMACAVSSVAAAGDENAVTLAASRLAHLIGNALAVSPHLDGAPG